MFFLYPMKYSQEHGESEILPQNLIFGWLVTLLTLESNRFEVLVFADGPTDLLPAHKLG